jgi:hypothetical protein
MKTIPGFSITVLLCGILTLVVASFVAPSVIHFLFTPPVSFGVNCEPAVDYALRGFRTTQLIGFVLGAVGGAAFIFLRSKKTAK